MNGLLLLWCAVLIVTPTRVFETTRTYVMSVYSITRRLIKSMDRSIAVTRVELHDHTLDARVLTGEIRELRVIFGSRDHDTDFRPITVSRPSSSVVT